MVVALLSEPCMAYACQDSSESGKGGVIPGVWESLRQLHISYHF